MPPPTLSRFAGGRFSGLTRPPAPKPPNPVTSNSGLRQDVPVRRLDRAEKPIARTVPTIPLRTAAAVGIGAVGAATAIQVVRGKGLFGTLGGGDSGGGDGSNDKQQPKNPTILSILEDVTGIPGGLVALLVVFGVGILIFRRL